MTQQEFMESIIKMYRTANRADDRNVAVEYNEHWTAPQMSGDACCRHLDRMMRDLVSCGVISETQHQYILDSV